jgi:tetratricopeptide (TPR) repeat protein
MELNKKLTYFFLLLTILIQLFLYIPHINKPLMGIHHWRQAQGLAIARNFYEEDMNILKPRSDNRGDLTGITGMEFPLVNYITALGYRVFGYHLWVHRLVMYLFNLLALVFCYLFFYQLLKKRLYGVIAAFSLAFSPLFSYYSFVMLPDNPMLAFLFISLFFLQKWINKNQYKHFLYSLFFLLFSALIKISALIVLPYILLCIYRRFKEKKNYLSLLFPTGFVFLVILSWYVYASYTSALFANFDFRLVYEFPKNLGQVLQPLIAIFFRYLPGLYINYIQVIFLIAGILYLSKKGEKEIKELAKIFLVSFILYMSLFLPMFTLHDYYMIPFLPGFVFLIVYGYRFFLEKIPKSGVIQILLVILTLLTPAACISRLLIRFENSYIERFQGIEAHLNQSIPDKKALVIACSDVSPAIYLYHFHRKGWAITDSIKAAQFKEKILKGARYLVCDSRVFEQRQDIKKLLKFHSEFNEFKIFQLKRPPSYPESIYNQKYFPQSDFFFKPNQRLNNFSWLFETYNKRVLTKESRKKKRLWLQALSFIKSKNYKGAGGCFQQMIKKRLHDTHTYFQMGICYGEQNNFQKEVEAYIKAIEIDTENDFAYFNLYYLFSQSGNYTELIKILENFIAKQKESFYTYLWLGSAYAETRDFPSAIKYLKQALALNPQIDLAYRTLGEIYFAQGKYRLALKNWEKIAHSNSQDTLLLYRLGLSSFFLQQFNQSRHYFHTIIKHKPVLPGVYFYNGIASFETGNYEEAIRNFNKPVSQKNLPLSLFYKGISHLLIRQPRETKKISQRLRGIAPFLAVELFNMYYQTRTEVNPDIQKILKKTKNILLIFLNLS